MISPRSQVVEFIEQGVIPEENIDDALRVVGVFPDGHSWRSFLDRFFLWLGGLGVAVAAIFFIAYNWSQIGRFGKFGLIEGGLILVILLYCRSESQSIRAKVSLLVATIFLGVLLALYGQTYQTGADSWQLFFSWALLMVPWAVVSRLPAMWIVWIGLINVSIFLYYDVFHRTAWSLFYADINNLWLPFCCNTTALVVWELSAKMLPWLAEKWAIRLLAVGGGIPITALVFQEIFSYNGDSLLPWLVWLGWITVMFVVYRKAKPDLFMLAGCCLSGILVIMSVLTKILVDDVSAIGLLFLALIAVALGGGSAFWLKKVHREMQS